MHKASDEIWSTWVFFIFHRLQFKFSNGQIMLLFNHKWLSDEKLTWLKEFKGDKQKAMCCVYKSDWYATHGRKCFEVSYERRETQEEHLIVQLPV